jgi:membrane-associated phospholipid phosphatase
MTDIRKFYVRLTVIYYIIWIGLFLIVGWYANQLPAVDLSLGIDDKITLIPQFVWIYLLCFIYPFLLLTITKSWHWYNIALLASVFCTVIAYAVHITMPVIFAKPQLGPGISENILGFIYRHDFKPGAQNLPSLHVSLSLIVYLAASKQQLKKIYEIIILLFSMLIILSTLFVKQHLLVDVIAGVLVTIFVWYGIQLYYFRNFKIELDPRTALKKAIRKLWLYFVLSAVFIFIIALTKSILV